MKENHYKKGDIIFREGEDGESLFYIMDGSVGIFVNYATNDEQRLAVIGKDHFFGEMAVIETYPRSATALALDDVIAIEISSGELSDYFKQDPDMIVEMMQHLGSRIRSLTDDYSEMCEAIEEVDTKQDLEKKSDSFIEKVKKLAGAYAHNKNAAKLESVESARKLEMVDHSSGFTTDVEAFKKGTIIFKEGEPGKCMYDIHSGSVGIYKAYGTPDEKCLTTLSVNKFFGEMGMLEDDVRSATAVVLEDETTLEIIFPKDLKELFNQNPAKVEMIIAHMSYRLRKLTNEYNDACKRIYEKLNELDFLQ